MRILGIDPGSQITGLGVVDSRNRELVGVRSQTLRLPPGDLAVRCGKIYEAVAALIRETRPNVVAVEQVFIAKNPQAALTLGHARGAAVCAAVNAQKPVVEYSAKQIKQAVVGTGGAKKDQVQHMVRVLLSLSEVPQSDAADALACAICHAHHAELEKKLRQAGV